MIVDAMDSISDNPETCQFLASVLVVFMAVERPRRGRWSKRRIANTINASESIPGSVSDTTLGRLLDPESDQAPSIETLRALATFLMERRWIDPADLELMSDAVRLRQMNELAAFYDVPDTGAQRRFISDISGVYSGWRFGDQYLGIHRLSLRQAPEVPGLIVRETFRSFRAGRTALKKMPERPTHADLIRTPVLLGKMGISPKSAMTGGGIALVGSGFGVALMRDSSGNFPSALSIETITFLDEIVVGISGRRSTTWQALDHGAFPIPERFSSLTSEVDRLRYLSAQIHTEKLPILDKCRKTMLKEPHSSIDIREFFGMTDSEHEEDLREIENDAIRMFESQLTDDMSLSRQLSLALDCALLSRFRTLLKEGADPNEPRPGNGLPMVFELASIGWEDWIEAMLESGRLDLTITDKRSMRPSFHAGVAAREAAEDEDSYCAEIYGRIYRRLMAEELRQLGLDPSPTSDEPDEPSP
ncbi:MAG: hypothetical protein TEF_21965 [Rhizobiales bacterium NRL2]|nr:MAG: hypothetical protein TEF_21965 [Rhizobiales bacterium NRL2]